MRRKCWSCIFILLIYALPIILILVTSSSAQLETTNDSSDAVMASAQSPEHELPPIFVLNMDRSKDRWRKMYQQLVDAGIESNVVRVSAVDGRALSMQDLKAQSSRMAVYLQPRGVIGCYLSHLKFWKLVVEQKYMAAIVFEDDVKLVDGFKEKLVSMLQQVTTDDYDVLLLGALGN